MKTTIPLKLIKLEDNNFHIVVPSLFDDDIVRYWLIDTGASKTVFDSNLSDRYILSDKESDQVHTAGINDPPIDSAMAYLHQFSLGALKFKNFEVSLLDLTHINQLYSERAGITLCGMLGGNFLVNNKAKIDYKKMQLQLRSVINNQL